MTPPNGHQLSGGRVLVGHEVCTGHGGHTTWTCCGCEATVYGAVKRLYNVLDAGLATEQRRYTYKVRSSPVRSMAGPIGMTRMARACAASARIPSWGRTLKVSAVGPNRRFRWLEGAVAPSACSAVDECGQRTGGTCGGQHSTRLTGTVVARPPVEVSLYFELMSCPVERIVSMT